MVQYLTQDGGMVSVNRTTLAGELSITCYKEMACEWMREGGGEIDNNNTAKNRMPMLFLPGYLLPVPMHCVCVCCAHVAGSVKVETPCVDYALRHSWHSRLASIFFSDAGSHRLQKVHR